MLGGLAALIVMALGTQSAFAEPSTTCVKATKVKPSKKRAETHFTGAYNDKLCAQENLTHEGEYEKLADVTPQELYALEEELMHVGEEWGIAEGKLAGACLSVHEYFKFVLSYDGNEAYKLFFLSGTACGDSP